MPPHDDDGRPDPDALLERVQAEDRAAARAKLRIWLGASPGVGKTYSMLEDAQRLAREGGDVVVGIVETHGRAETGALLEGLEQLPRKRVTYRGRLLDELDLDAVLARRPRVVLVDELAHTNAPGSRHAKRWQDAIELLDAGIDVHTTMNVQHVESLNDVISQITHVRVRETVPDALIERADQVELVDVPPEVVLARLAEGKVYVPEQAQRAAASFFKQGNLHALRELALRVTAERVDADVQAWRRQHGIAATWPTRERILVCIGPSPASQKLVRTARRMASAIRAPWLAVYVEKPSGAIPEADRARLQSNLRLAESLGAEVVVLSAERAADAILELARRRNVTRIVAGKPTHPRWRDFVYGSMLDDIVRGSGDIDVHVITGEQRTPTAPPSSRDQRPGAPLGSTRGVLPVIAGAAVAALVRDHVDLADVAMIFLVSIAVAAAFLGRGASVVASLLAVAIFDFFFVPPFYTFAVADFRHVFTFAVMLCAGILISGLTDRIRRQSVAARERERRTAALYEVTRALATARDVRAVAGVAHERVRDVFESDAVLLVSDPEAPAGLRAPAPPPLELQDGDRTVARWALDHARPAGKGLETLPGARVLAMPLLAEGDAVGVLAILPRPEDRFEDSAQRFLLQAVVGQIALALERALLEEDARRAELRAETEAMRSALLASVSHDLRTPIAAVLGSATALLDTSLRIPESERTALLAQIRDEAARLGRLVSNLLTMTRVESGALRVRSEWVPLEELVGAALSRVERRLEGHELTVDVEPDAMARVDSVLFEQMIINLLDNAASHTPPGTPIAIRVARRPGAVILEVSDRGPGLPPGSERRIFDMFVRGADGGRGGVGLGLAICRGIVQAHGGTISAENRSSGGALFRVVLPVEGEPPRVAPEAHVPAEGASS